MSGTKTYLRRPGFMPISRRRTTFRSETRSVWLWGCVWGSKYGRQMRSGRVCLMRAKSELYADLGGYHPSFSASRLASSLRSAIRASTSPFGTFPSYMS